MAEMAETPVRIETAKDPESLAQSVAGWITDRAAASRDRFAIGLSGGSTPRRLYQLLAQGPFCDALPWDRIHWFWGDERFVPWDHPDSNYGMARTAMLANAPAPPQNIHGIPTSGTPDQAARAYERILKDYYGAEELDPARPLFDLQILGLGPDGHTASLIPGTSALDERRRWVVSVVGARPEIRITLTYPALESSRQTIFLVAGAEKREILARALAGDQTLPAARVRPIGELTWFVDAGAYPRS
jgi:6-phosphogluconolactonase